MNVNNSVLKHLIFFSEFCTDFPAALKTDDDCDKNFPVEIITSDYCHAAPTIRDERSRIVTLKVCILFLFVLCLNNHFLLSFISFKQQS